MFSSIELGKAGDLETLCRQAYGAKQYQKLGIYTYTDIFSYSTTNTHRPRSSNLTIAHMYSICLIPHLFSYAILQSLNSLLPYSRVWSFQCSLVHVQLFVSIFPFLIKRIILCQMPIKSIVIVVVFIIISLLLCHHRCRLCGMAGALETLCGQAYGADKLLSYALETFCDR
ncbi:protein detoxification 6 [Quercus suber]|uniref:Protein detoxification 6 n=1 Tax=Quercus suber TaxID=58331 RepID=A0AAW0KL78_QUESU